MSEIYACVEWSPPRRTKGTSKKQGGLLASNNMQIIYRYSIWLGGGVRKQNGRVVQRHGFWEGRICGERESSQNRKTRKKKRTKKNWYHQRINTLYDNQGTLSNDNLGRIFEHSGRGFRSHWVWTHSWKSKGMRKGFRERSDGRPKNEGKEWMRSPKWEWVIGTITGQGDIMEEEEKDDAEERSESGMFHSTSSLSAFSLPFFHFFAPW